MEGVLYNEMCAKNVTEFLNLFLCKFDLNSTLQLPLAFRSTLNNINFQFILLKQPNSPVFTHVFFIFRLKKYLITLLYLLNIFKLVLRFFILYLGQSVGRKSVHTVITFWAKEQP